MKKIIESLIFLGIKAITLNYLVVKKLIRKYGGREGRVLDLGSGNGYLAPLFSRSAYLGYEIDVELVEEAKKTHPGYRFIAGDATTLKLKDKFDLILIVGVIHHLSNDQFNRILDVLKRQMSGRGKAIIIEAIPPISKWNLLGKLIRRFDRGDYIRSTASYRSKLEKSFKLAVSRKVKGGIIDYALFVISHKRN